MGKDENGKSTAQKCAEAVEACRELTNEIERELAQGGSASRFAAQAEQLEAILRRLDFQEAAKSSSKLARKFFLRWPWRLSSNVRERELELPPRLWLDWLLRRVMNPKAYRQNVEPKIADMHEQFFERLAAGDKPGAWWARIRGNYYATPKWLRLVVLQIVVGVVHGLVVLLRWLF